ncbi:uncharacterized protein BKA55DRAFT_576794 [Fusarium redolens]|uniref:Uncharacterized protein n=1 Tax=Fusarium redolens TaxID=48865 RepID=A0A9P9K109_FUSRE|nr:uncharacterized protein BKA55DRAFT_576794 [Fusarium redolens]KAH7239940.1 hypothetical protein BKA55DRAFT_576794 [Fusarium redolens]
MLEHVVAVQKETLDEKDYLRLASEHILATAYLGNQRIKEAIKILEHVVAIKAEMLAENNPSRQLSVNLLQDCFKRLEVAYNNNNV